MDMAKQSGIAECLMLSEEWGKLFVKPRGLPIMEREKVKMVLRLLNDAGIPYAIVGAVALAQYVEPRFTHDLDLMVLVEDGPKVRRLLEPYYGRGAVNVMFFEVEGTQVDVLLARLRYERHAVRRAMDILIDDVPAKVVDVRDLVLMKLLAAWERPQETDRQQDRVDIQRLLTHHGHKLTPDDIAYIAERLRELCFLPEEVARWQERMQWLNETLERLDLVPLRYRL